MSVPRSFYHMIEAKRFAQLDPSVGQKTQIAYIPPSEDPLLFQDDGVTTMKDWMKAFGLQDTEELDKETVRSQFEQEARKAALPTS
jgi:hypothetical protein